MYSSQNVMVSPGSKELLFLTQMAFNGDLVLLSPSWVSYEPQARMTRQKVQRIFTHEEDGYLVTPRLLEDYCIKNRTTTPKMLLLNYPGNPSGTTYSELQLEDITQIARQYNLLILSDEIYGEIHHNGEHLSMAQFYPEGTIISTGMSKWCGAGGWRLGTFIFPENLFALRDAMATMASETYTTASAPIQYAATTAFRGNKDIDTYIHDSRKVLKHIANYVQRSLLKMDVTSPKPEGAGQLTCSAHHQHEGEQQGPLVDPDRFVSRQLFDPGSWQAATCHMCAEEYDGQTLVSPSCVANCPTGAARIADWDHPDYGTSRVRYIERRFCRGCGGCVESCPFEHPFLQAGTARKCDLCAASGDEPPCVDAWEW